MNHGAHGIINPYQFIDAGSAPVAQLITKSAADGTVQRRRVFGGNTHGIAIGVSGRVRLLAVIAQHPHQSLCENPDHAG